MSNTKLIPRSRLAELFTDHRTIKAFENLESQIRVDLPADISQQVQDSMAAHLSAPDPHTQYQKESEKDQANGYVGLDALLKINGARVTYGTTANTAVEGNDPRLNNIASTFDFDEMNAPFVYGVGTLDLEEGFAP